MSKEIITVDKLNKYLSDEIRIAEEWNKTIELDCLDRMKRYINTLKDSSFIPSVEDVKRWNELLYNKGEDYVKDDILQCFQDAPEKPAKIEYIELKKEKK